MSTPPTICGLLLSSTIGRTGIIVDVSVSSVDEGRGTPSCGNNNGLAEDGLKIEDSGGIVW